MIIGQILDFFFKGCSYRRGISLLFFTLNSGVNFAMKISTLYRRIIAISIDCRKYKNEHLQISKQSCLNFSDNFKGDENKNYATVLLNNILLFCRVGLRWVVSVDRDVSDST